MDCNQNALVGYENGIIALISLTDGRCLATCSINEAIKEMYLYQDNNMDAIFLLINGESGQQWKHVLEQHSVGYIWPPELANHSDESTRSRVLYNLRQMGADKFASLKQRLVEGRTRRDSANSETTSDSSHSDISSVSSAPERLPNLCDAYFSPQYAKDRYLFSAFYKQANLLTIHTVDMDTNPLYTHRLLPQTDELLLTDKLIFAINSERNAISVISAHLSECRLEGDSEFNEDALIAQFHLDKEKILHIFKLADFSSTRLKKCKEERKDTFFEMPKTVNDLKIRRPRVDTCVIITNKAVYKIHLSVSPVHQFVNFVTEENNLDKAENIATIFGLNLQQLLENCGDLLLSRGSFHSGIILYKHAKLHLLKRVLKLAISADCRTLLKFVHLCLSSSKVDMSVVTKIHIGNVAVMAYTELILRYGGSQRLNNTRDFMNFLRHEEFYDQILAVNVACQAAQWNIVSLLAKFRGLQPEVVTAFGQILQSARAPRPNDIDFTYSLSEPCLTQSLLTTPKSSQIILRYIKKNLKHFPTEILKRFANQLDPSQPCALPLIGRRFQSCKSTISLDSTIESVDSRVNGDFNVVNEFIETFVLVLVQLLAKNEDNSFNLVYLDRIKGPDETIPPPLIKKIPDLRPLSCGYEHAAIIRNGDVYTMGISSTGCLGLGPLLSQSSPPKIVQTLADVKVKAISVSCGRKHTLILTDYGVYVCGSNNYGQLGIGPFVQESPYPQIIAQLCFSKIIDVVAGQYHSLALTSDGRVYTWGWGIHGQLGHGTCDNEFFPKLLEFNQPVKQIAGGHAHTLILTEDGQLFGFGSNVFGQLEGSQLEANKSNIPIKINITSDIHERVKKITSAFFHNVVLKSDHKVYAWGSSPQEVRMHQSKNHHKENGISLKSNDNWKSAVLVYNDVDEVMEQISVGYRHVALLTAGNILWGKTKEGELKYLKLGKEQMLLEKFRYLHVSCGSDYMMAIDQLGRLLAWGSISMAQTILGRTIADEQKMEDRIIVSRSNRKVIKYSTIAVDHSSEQTPIEVEGLPKMAITFNPIDHQLIISKDIIPYSVLQIENSDSLLWSCKSTNKISPMKSIQNTPHYLYGQKTLHFVLENYYGMYDSEQVQQKCIDVKNFQAASKIAMLGSHYGDSLSLQLKAFKKFMKCFDLDFQKFYEEFETYNKLKKEENYLGIIKSNNDEKKVAPSTSSEYLSNSPAHLLSASSSLDSIRHWDELDHQGGRESPCEITNEFGGLHSNMFQFVESIRNNQSPSITSISKFVSEAEKIAYKKDEEFVIRDKNVKNVIETAGAVVEYYIEKAYSSENRILMQNTLVQCIEFWLENNLPVSILEDVLLKHLEKYFYPLSILLFCKDFCDDEKDLKDGAKNRSASFFKEFSTKFCLQLCSMVVDNVNKA